MQNQNPDFPNPLIKIPKQKRENILNPLNPLDDKAPSIGNTALYGYPTFDLEKWDQKLKDTVDPTKNIVPLEDEAEKLVIALLKPCHEELQEEVKKAIEKIRSAPMLVAGSFGSFRFEGDYQKDKVKSILNELYEKEEEIINAACKEILRKFDENVDGFQEAFIAGLKSKDSKEPEPTPEEAKKAARELLVSSRLKQEQDRINKQKNLEKEICDGIDQITNRWSELEWAKRHNRKLKGDDELYVGQLGEELDDRDLSTTFGKKSPNLFDAFFKGEIRCTAYIKDQTKEGHCKITFDPRDPDSRAAFIAYVRACGPDAKVNIKLGWGTSYETGPYNSMNPKNSRVLFKIAMEYKAAFMGFDKIPPKYFPITKVPGTDYHLRAPLLLTGDSIMKDFKYTNKLPDEIASLVVALKIPNVNIENFQPRPEDQAEIERWEGIANAIRWCKSQLIDAEVQSRQEHSDGGIQTLEEVLQGPTIKTNK